MLPARGRSQPANSLPAAVCPSVCKRCPDSARVLTQARPDVLPCWQPPGVLAGPRPCSRLGTFWMKHWPRVRHTTLQHTRVLRLLELHPVPWEPQGHRVPVPVAVTASTWQLSCWLVLGSLCTDPTAEMKHPPPVPLPLLGKPPRPVCNAHPWPAVLPARLPSAGDEPEPGMALPEPVAKPARVQNPVAPRRSAAPAAPAPRGGCEAGDSPEARGTEPVLENLCRADPVSSSTDLPCDTCSLAAAQGDAGPRCAIGSTALSAAQVCRQRSVPAAAPCQPLPSWEGGGGCSCPVSQTLPCCGPSFPAVTFSKATGAR